jgi:hypothetical protein
VNEMIKAIGERAKELRKLYSEQRRAIEYKRSLDEFLQFERLKLNELRSVYADKLSEIKFLKGTYITDFSRFERHQEIPSEYFVKGPTRFYFISHRWESSKDPDPSGRQFNCFKAYFDRLPRQTRELSGFWYDYSCIPQMDAAGKRSPEEEASFADALKAIHLLTTLSHTVVLFTRGYLDRTWCCAEWIFATSISPLLVDVDQVFPFGNTVKFRHLALVILFLSHNLEMKKLFLSGSDLSTCGFLNALLERTLASTRATWGSDKLFIKSVMHRHFWYHVRLLGLVNQLATAFLLLEQYEEDFIEQLFKQFIFLSEDLELIWTKEVHFNLETMILKGPDPFKDAYFEQREITVIPHSYMRMGVQESELMHRLQEAASLVDQGQLEEALNRLNLEEGLCRQLNAKRELALCLCTKVEISEEKGELDEAIPMLEEVEQLGRELNIPGYIEGSLHGRARILLRRQCYEDALAAFRQQERYCREMKSDERLINCLGAQATILLIYLNDPGTALTCALEARELASELGMKELYDELNRIVELAGSRTR